MFVFLNQVKSLGYKSVQTFAGIGNKRKPTKKDLDKYDVIVIGSNLGGILSRHFDKKVHGKYTMMVCLDNSINQVYSMRPVYEQGRVSKTQYLPNAKLAINTYTANSELVGVDKINPEENSVTLRNGRKIGYNHLVVAMGMQHNVDAIKGFEDAWKDLEHPVFTAKDYPTWRTTQNKHQRFYYNYNSGDAYFCIPTYPFAGEIETYNFFVAQQVWSWFKAHGKLSPINSFTVVNSNDRFSQFSDSADAFIKEELTKRGIKVEYGLTLQSVDMKTYTATFKNNKTGEIVTRPYSNLYSLLPTKPHANLQEAGLLAPNGLLDVDHQTLRHKKYKNIFGLGDICNIPTTKTFWAGFYQVHVVRNNLQRSLQGQSLNALYDGFTKVPIITGQANLTYVSHYYNNVEGWQHLWHKSGGPIGRFRYYYWGKSQKKEFLNYYLEKSFGPPYHKRMPGFSEIPGSAEANDNSGGFLGKYFAHKKSA